MLWNAKEARLWGVRVSRPGCRQPSGLLPTRVATEDGPRARRELGTGSLT